MQASVFEINFGGNCRIIKCFGKQIIHNVVQLPAKYKMNLGYLKIYFKDNLEAI